MPPASEPKTKFKSKHKASRIANEANRSHSGQPLYLQWDTLKTTRTKPRRSSSMVSMDYGHFDPVFSQVVTDGRSLYVADLGGQGGRQNEAKRSHGG